MGYEHDESGSSPASPDVFYIAGRRRLKERCFPVEPAAFILGGRRQVHALPPPPARPRT